MMSLGTTLVEAKSGYGLDLDTEVKMMKVLHEANKLHDMDIVVNYCGAHVIFIYDIFKYILYDQFIIHNILSLGYSKRFNRRRSY